MANGEGKAAWGWGQPASEEPAPPENGPARSRWGSDIPDQPEKQAATEVTNPQEPGLFSSVSAQAPVSFPQPHTQLDTPAGKERWERSHTWLSHLDQSKAPADRTAAPVRPEKPRRSRPARRRLRTRKQKVLSVLLTALVMLLTVVVIGVSVPSLRERALSLLPSFGASTSNPAQGTLVARSDVADSTLNIGGQHYDISQKDQGFWSVSVPLNPGAYTITISAPNYSPASGHVQIITRQTQVITALLSLSPGMLATLLSSTQNQIAGQPLAQGVQTGDQYTGGQTASQSLAVTINYRVISLVDKPGASVLEPGTITSVPKTVLSGVVTPDVAFSTQGGASAGEYRPGPLPSSNFLISLNVLFDASGQPSFGLGNPAAIRVISGAGTPLTAPGGVNADVALLYALTQASLTQGSQASAFTCIGLADTVNSASGQPDPEDGLMLALSGSAAHYFYRWGQLWTTNSAANTLNPELPQANEDTLVLAQNLINAQQADQPTGCT